MPILPIFLRYPDEAAIVGRLLAGYGELEFQVLSLLSPAMGGANTAAKVLYRTRGEEQRILIADAIIRDRILDNKLLKKHEEAISDLHHCRKIRNQYAHCHWDSDQNGGLAINILEDGAKKNDPIMTVKYLSIDIELLKSQENYFVFTEECLGNIICEFRKSLGLDVSWIQKFPKKMARPPLYRGR